MTSRLLQTTLSKSFASSHSRIRNNTQTNRKKTIRNRCFYLFQKSNRMTLANQNFLFTRKRPIIKCKLARTNLRTISLLQHSRAISSAPSFSPATISNQRQSHLNAAQREAMERRRRCLALRRNKRKRRRKSQMHQ